MRRPSIRHLPRPLAAAARAVATTLHEHGRRAWLVGGAVRDLALEREPTDVDLATAATPDEVERWFRRTNAVGRAFGTMLVRDAGPEVQVTTFRAERGYGDARHPDEVRYAETPEEDALRRDFTCNALFLDPLTDELRDPEGGLADLEAGVLRCVGEPGRRFTEDGLRLLRLARFAAELGLAVEPGTRAAAEASLDALRGVSGERAYAELERIATGADPGRGVALLDELGVLGRLLPGWDAAAEERRGVLARLAPDAGLAAWLAALCGGDGAALEPLRPPRAAVRAVDGVGAALARLGGARGRAEALRLVREPTWPAALAVARARGGADAERALELERLRASLAPEELRPAPLLDGDDLRRAGLAPGPRFGALLAELETLQLEGRLRTREEALAWLAERAPG